MKFCTVAAVLLVSLFATSMALPATYYQQPSFYYQPRAAAPQRMMYMQYVQKPAARTSARYVGEVQESVLDNTGANGAQSVAEAYPSSSEVEEQQYDAPAEIAEEENQVPEESPVYEDDAAQAADENDAAIAEPAVPEIPADLPEEAENDDDEDAEEEAVVPTNTRKVSQKAPPAPLPVGTFFPIDFGGATGGSIALANSFSTGANGSSKSQAIAYGKAESVSTKSRPVRRH